MLNLWRHLSRAVRVEILQELLSFPMMSDDILADHLDLEREDLLAVLVFAAWLAGIRRLYTHNLEGPYHGPRHV
jgi:hypothetical protein